MTDDGELGDFDADGIPDLAHLQRDDVDNGGRADPFYTDTSAFRPTLVLQR